MTNHQKPGFSAETRGHKTRGYSYKDRYVKDVPCPECGGMSAYKDTWHTKFSYKCMKRDCKHNWFVDRFPKKETDRDQTDD